MIQHSDCTRLCEWIKGCGIVAVVASAFLVAMTGCPTAGGGGGGGDGPPPPPPACAEIGQTCTDAGDCCDDTAVCTGGTCQADGGGGSGNVADGQATYETSCMACHGTPTEGGGAGPDLATDTAEDLQAGSTAQGHPFDASGLSQDDFADLEAFLAEGGGDGGGSFAEQRGFVGTDTCLSCHGATAITGTDYSDFLITGHPFKLNESPGNEPPQYPVTELPSPPEPLEWSDVSYVIGGYRWKYRVMDEDGYVVLGPTAQYNFPSRGFSAYSNDADHTSPDGTPGPWDANIGRKPYACGPCHMTGYEEEVPSHSGLEGITGDWAFGGVHCEECHGAGQDHVSGPSASNINGSPETDATCGKCHTRSSDGIAAKGGFIRHHEQWDEFSRTKHASVMPDGCMTCHNVHKPLWTSDALAAVVAAFDGDPTAVDALPSPAGIIRQCTDCHGSVTVTHEGPDDCISCHMAFTAKSAVALNDNMGDVRGHSWKINDDPAAMMFADADGNPVSRDDSNVAFAALDGNDRPFITLDFACLRCHTGKDVQWAADNAASIHAGG
ncbi:MAG: c-type cytochrome [Phycisphaerae bacterium]